MAENKSVGTRLSEDVVEEIDEFADERGLSRSEALRRAAEAYFIDGGEQKDDSNDTETIREQLRVTFFERLLPIVVAAIVAATIVLLAIGGLEAGVGSLLGSASVVGVLGIGVGADRRLDQSATTAREAVAELQNPTLSTASKWVWARLRGDHPAPLEPRTLVERLAVVDLYGLLLLWATVLAMIPAGIGVLLWGSEAVVVGVGASAILVYFYVVTLGFAVAFLCFLVGYSAQLAIGTAASSTPTADADTDPDT